MVIHVTGEILEYWQGMTNAFALRKKMKRQRRNTGDTEAGQRVAFSASGVGGNAKIGIRFYGKGSSKLEVNTGVFI